MALLQVLSPNALPTMRALLNRIQSKVITGTSYTLTPEDSGQMIIFTSNNQVTVTVPNVDTVDLGANYFTSLRQGGSGPIYIVLEDDADDSLIHIDNGVRSAGRGALVTITRGQNENTYYADGPLV